MISIRKKNNIFNVYRFISIHLFSELKLSRIRDFIEDFSQFFLAGDTIIIILIRLNCHINSRILESQTTSKTVRITEMEIELSYDLIYNELGNQSAGLWSVMNNV